MVLRMPQQEKGSATEAIDTLGRDGRGVWSWRRRCVGLSLVFVDAHAFCLKGTTSPPPVANPSSHPAETFTHPHVHTLAAASYYYNVTLVLATE
jgi:hypothetical protein